MGQGAWGRGEEVWSKGYWTTQGIQSSSERGVVIYDLHIAILMYDVAFTFINAFVFKEHQPKTIITWANPHNFHNTAAGHVDIIRQSPDLHLGVFPYLISILICISINP